MNRKIVLAASLAFALTICTAHAFAQGSGSTNKASLNHQVAEHGYDQVSHEIISIAFNEHGGAHEQAPNNAAVHAQEMKDPGHKIPPAAANIPFEQHGGAHEKAPNNAEIHQQELKNPAHKD